jgi:hypothetical protein
VVTPWFKRPKSVATHRFWRGGGDEKGKHGQQPSLQSKN